MKNYLEFERDIKELEEELEKLKDPFNKEGISEVETDKIAQIQNQIDEKLLYTITNMGFQDNKYLIISSLIPLKSFKVKLKDLSSRFTSFIDVGINLPTDDLIRVILTKNFSDKQIEITKKNIEYILKNIDRSYEKVNLFTNSVDNLSLAKAKPINLSLIKKVLKELKF